MSIDDAAFFIASQRFEHLLSPDTFRKFLEIYQEAAKYEHPVSSIHAGGGAPHTPPYSED